MATARATGGGRSGVGGGRAVKTREEDGKTAGPVGKTLPLIFFFCVNYVFLILKQNKHKWKPTITPLHLGIPWKANKILPICPKLFAKRKMRNLMVPPKSFPLEQMCPTSHFFPQLKARCMLYRCFQLFYNFSLPLKIVITQLVH